MRRVAAPQPGPGEEINKHIRRDKTNVSAMAKRLRRQQEAPKLKGTERPRQIATFLGEPTSVAQRWVAQGMPVRRQGRYITTTPDQLNAWLEHESGKPVHVATNDTDLTAELKSAESPSCAVSSRSSRLGPNVHNAPHAARLVDASTLLLPSKAGSQGSQGRRRGPPCTARQVDPVWSCKQKQTEGRSRMVRSRCKPASREASIRKHGVRT